METNGGGDEERCESVEAFHSRWLAGQFLGCGVWQSQPAHGSFRFSGFDTVAGKWEGLSKRVPDMRDHAWVILIISENGHFHFASNRATGLFLGTVNFPTS